MRHLFLCISLISAISLPSQSLSAFFDYKTFIVPDQGILLEVYVNITGYSVAYLPVNDTLSKAQVEMNLIISSGDKVIDFKKELVQSPLAFDDYQPDFMSLSRFLLPQGTYVLELNLRDLGKDESVVKTVRTIVLAADYKACAFSDIELVAGFRQAEETSTMAKSGYEFLPYMNNLFGEEFNELLFYAELYNTDRAIGKDEGFVFKYGLKDANNGKTVAECEVIKRKKAAHVITELGKLNITAVPSGLYDLTLEARNRDNELMASQSLRIIRQNDDVVKNYTPEEIDMTFVGKINDRDSLKAYIDCLTPISYDGELMVIDHQMKNATLLECKSFFYSFWERRDLVDPSAAWQAYKAEVIKAEDKFGTSNKRGFMTDMGRVYLKYGAPNSIVDQSSDPEAYPYQIWHYYRAGKFSDKRFVFYDRELLHREYQLLHSDVPGEVRNPRWDMVLNSRNNAQWNTEQNSAGGNSSSRMQELFETPR